MTYDQTTGLILIGVTFTLAYLSTKFNESNSVLQLFFTITTLVFIPADLAVLSNILTVESVDSSVIGIVDGLFGASVWLVVIFIAILMVQLLYNFLVKGSSDIR